MTTVQTCKECGKLFSFLPRGLCAGCIDYRESQYQLVREWLAENHGRTIAAVTEGSGVERKLITEFIDEGRLELIVDGSPAGDEQRSRNALRALIASELAMSDSPHATSHTPTTPTAPTAAATPAAPARHSGMRTRS